MRTPNPAIQKLNEGYACVVQKPDGGLACAEGIGVKPLMAFLREDGRFFEGAAVADKVVGKAAALLLVKGGVREVYGRVMSEAAMAVFRRFGIPYSFETAVPFIQNRAGDGICPLEDAVSTIGEPEEAFPALEARIAELMANRG